MHFSLLTRPAGLGAAPAALLRRGSCSPAARGALGDSDRNPFPFHRATGAIDGARYAAAAGPLSPAAPPGRPRS